MANREDRDKSAQSGIGSRPEEEISQPGQVGTGKPSQGSSFGQGSDVSRSGSSGSTPSGLGQSDSGRSGFGESGSSESGFGQSGSSGQGSSSEKGGDMGRTNVGSTSDSETANRGRLDIEEDEDEGK